jgi:hypothetical protein
MWQPFASHQQHWMDPTAPKKRTPDIILSTQADRFAGLPPSFSPNKAIEVVMKSNHMLTTGYINLLGPYLQHVTSTFNTCSGGPTHRSLTDTLGGYNLGDTGLPHHTFRPSQPMVLRIPPKSPVRSQVNIDQHKPLAI